MGEDAYEIKEYSEENLAQALSSKVSVENVKERLHFLYLKKYLSDEKGIDAKTILIEHKYVSKAFITDYSNYYATCFQDYQRFCSRVHFFNIALDKEGFEKELFNLSSGVLEEAYLGYIVIKPLPDSIIGPTLLATYNKRNDGKPRYFPATHTYKVNLFGRELRIDTLAYQEQDTVVSACASVAIWSAFHQTSILFKTNLPSPSEITKLAGNQFVNYGRTYPNGGLDLTQICKAIDSVGLVSELRSSIKFDKDINLATRIIYAYLKAGIPVLLFIKDGATYKSSEDQTEERHNQPIINGHVITVAGYSEPNPEIPRTPVDPIPEITLLADRIDVFYIHDDQLGPFSKYTFSGKSALLKHTWDEQGNEKTEPAWIHSATIPLYPKIRIKYEDVFDTIALIDRIFFESKLFQYELEWDIYLIESNKYKMEVFNNQKMDFTKKRAKLLTNYPKYIWIGRAQIHDNPILDFIFDSTDTPNGNYCIDLTLHDRLAGQFVLGVFKDLPEIFVDDVDGPRLGKDVYNKMISELS